MVSQMVKMVATSSMESLAEDVRVHQAAILLLNVVLCDIVQDWITFEGTFHIKDRLCKGNFDNSYSIKPELEKFTWKIILPSKVDNDCN